MLRRLSPGTALVALLLLLASVGSASAAKPGATREDPLPSPRAVTLRGTHGYWVVLDANLATRRTRPEVKLTAYGHDAEISYAAPANLSGEGIHASLGRFGRVDLRWVPDGRVSGIRFSCHGGPPRRRYFFSRGAYVGTLRFRGGGGFTEAHARRIVWQPAWYRANETCSREGSESTPGQGEILEVRPGKAAKATKPGLVAYQARAGGRVEYFAEGEERVGSVEITREAFASGGPKTLSFAPDFSTATISPPAPFSGSASFERTEGARGTWLGDLAVEFADGTVSPFAGKSFEAFFYSGSREFTESR